VLAGVLVERTAVPAETTTPQTRHRWRDAWRLVRALVALQPRRFSIAVTGAAVFAVCTVASSVAVQWVVDHVIVPRFEEGSVSSSTVVAGVALLIGIGLVRAAGVVVRRTWAGKTQWRAAEDLADGVVDRLAAQPVPWQRRHPTGELVARAGVDVEAAVGILAPLPFASSVVLMMVLSAVWLLATDLLLGVVAVTVFPVLIAVNLVYQRRVDKHYDEAQHQLGRLSAAVHESFEGVTVVKAFGAEVRETDRLATIAARLRQARMSAVTLRGTFESLLTGIPTITNIALVLLGAYRVDAGAMTVGQVTSVIYLFTLLVFPLRLIGWALSELPHSQAGWARVRGVLDEAVWPDPASSLGVAPAGVGVALHAVTTSHDDTRDILSGFELTIPSGRTVALVGETGSGKTTLLQVIAGLVPVSGGTVAVGAGGTALVFQEPFLLAATVRENLTLGVAHTDDELWAVLDAAEARDFVEALPEGLDTTVGERGVGLSGGQRQRIALARAVLRRPALVLLDDTTSALDPATETKVLANLRSVLSGATVLAVASRPSTIAVADEVVYLRDGRVAAHGTHADLMASEDDYRHLMLSFEHDRAAHAAEAAAGGGGS
jgi:ABC-type multidrug transport system fused ATPase/permease subunit